MQFPSVDSQTTRCHLQKFVFFEKKSSFSGGWKFQALNPNLTLVINENEKEKRLFQVQGNDRLRLVTRDCLDNFPAAS